MIRLKLFNRNFLGLNRIAVDTAKLTAVSMLLQALGIFLNTLISQRLGTASVGIMTLIFTLFGFIMVLANGNIFLSTSRLVSEEIGFGNRNVSLVMRYSLSFSMTLSVFFMLASGALAGIISDKLAGGGNLSAPIRIIALSLPFASFGSCIKGYFNAVRKISIPCLGDCIEFAAKWTILLISVLFLIGRGYDLYLLIALSILIGEIISAVYYIVVYTKEYVAFSRLPSKKRSISAFSKYMRLCIPILISGYVQMLMSTANDVLVPAALLKYNASAERALGEYGMFEAMIMPALFYPALLLGSLSNVIIPEIARAHASGDQDRVKHLVHKILSKSLMFSFFAAGIFLTQGKNIGAVLCPSDTLVGETLVKLFPVVPFIYLEIVLEGILKGMGRQNFSTLNSLAEYAVRILCVIIFVRLYGFAGVLISYYASNIYSNIARIFVVLRISRLSFGICDYLLRPFVCSASSCIAAGMLVRIFSPRSVLFSAVIYICAAGIAFILFCGVDRRFFSAENKYRKIAAH